MDAPPESLPRRARVRDAARGGAAPLGGGATASLPHAETVATRASEGRRGTGVRRLPQLHARANRRARSANALGARSCAGRRPDEARALRRGGPCRARCRLTLGTVPDRGLSLKR